MWLNEECQDVLLISWINYVYSDITQLFRCIIWLVLVKHRCLVEMIYNVEIGDQCIGAKLYDEWGVKTHIWSMPNGNCVCDWNTWKCEYDVIRE